MAGEGIEYTWGASKRFYCRAPLSSKRLVVSFDLLVRRSIEGVDISMCRRFAVKARRYMECYIHKYLLKINATDEELIEWTHDEYEMMYKNTNPIVIQT